METQILFDGSLEEFGIAQIGIYTLTLEEPSSRNSRSWSSQQRVTSEAMIFAVEPTTGEPDTIELLQEGLETESPPLRIANPERRLTQFKSL